MQSCSVNISRIPFPTSNKYSGTASLTSWPPSWTVGTPTWDLVKLGIKEQVCPFARPWCLLDVLPRKKYRFTNLVSSGYIPTIKMATLVWITSYLLRNEFNLCIPKKLSVTLIKNIKYLWNYWCCISNLDKNYYLYSRKVPVFASEHFKQYGSNIVFLWNQAF